MATAAMASATRFPTFSYSNPRKFSNCSSSLASSPTYPKPQYLISILRRPYNGLTHLGIPLRIKSAKPEKRRKYRGMIVYASLFGVGAPEALVIGVVALLVFGPKGLAEVARNLGKTLRAFQPTIRELQEVSREFKTTLEREIGLDDVPLSTNSSLSSSTDVSEVPPAQVKANGTPSTATPYASEDFLEETEKQSAMLATAAATITASALEAETLATKAYSSEDLLKVTEEQLAASPAIHEQAERPISPQEQTQGSAGVGAETSPPSEMRESER